MGKKKRKKEDVVKCEKCGSKKGVIRKYDMFICRRCFRELAEKMGFKKY